MSEQAAHMIQRLITVVVGVALVALGTAVITRRPSAHAARTAGSIYDFRVRTMADSEQSLGDFRGKSLLVVNTASRCGFTPQYRSLEALYQKYRSRGFDVLAFPANNFLGQEPGSNAEIQRFCSVNYHTSFPLFAKLSVKGRDIAPLYAYLTRDSGFPGDIPWNFTKFLVGPDGRVVARFDPSTDPLDSMVTGKLEKLLPPRKS